MVAATFRLCKRRLIHKTQAKACDYQLQKEKITFDITKNKERVRNESTKNIISGKNQTTSNNS